MTHTANNTNQEKVRKEKNYIKLKDITVSAGNHKLANTTLVWNIPAIKTCPNCSACKDLCYARKAERLYPKCLPCRERNLAASKRSDFVQDMIHLIDQSVKRYGIKVFRIHESGDFYSQAYADKWSDIAAALPEIQFWAYSKSPHRPVAKNINIVESIMPDGSLNFGNKEHIIDLAKRYHATICPYGLTKETDWRCGRECTACQRKQYVLFLKH